jgi:hypothetical protein
VNALVNRLVLVWIVASAACGPKVDAASPSPFEEDDPVALASGAPVAEPALAPKPTVHERRRHFEVMRTALNEVLDLGPAPLLRGMEVKPMFRDQRFDGWEIVQFMHGETRFDGLDLMPGDVVGRINQVALIRPHHLGALWTELRSASAVIIEVRRGEEDFELRFDVRDDAKPNPP